MKKIFTFVFLLFSVQIAMAGPVDERLAKEVGQLFLESQRRSLLGELELAFTEHDSQGENLYYLFTFDRGFVVVAGDDCSTPILAYSNDGVLDLDNLPIQMEERLQGYAEQIQYGREHRIPADETIARQWRLVREKGCLDDSPRLTYLDPLIKVYWNQNCLYNSLCPVDASGPCGHVYAGCNATAACMIMHYWQYPKRGVGSYTYTPDGYPEQSVDFSATVYDWERMPASLNASSTNEQVMSVAQLLWHFGVAAKSNYGPTSTTAVVNDVLRAMIDNFGYSNDMHFTSSTDNASWLASIKENLDKGYPLYYVAVSVAGSVHAFVCDGYDSFGLLHFNFGWGGNGDGYYAIGAINPGSHEFNVQNYAAFDIHPQIDFSDKQFTVGPNKKVTFSPGNLQYQASTNSWRFAFDQHQTMGNNNLFLSPSNSWWVDLFGWGTSGHDHGAVCYQPWSTSQNASDYYAYGSSTSNLFDQSGLADWGSNVIINGGNQAGLWRTLTWEEMEYLLFTRSTGYVTFRFAMACVNGVNGMLIFPDGWSPSLCGLNYFDNFNTASADFSTHVYDGDAWRNIEASGVVFLPVAGWRSGNSLNNWNQYANYWTSTRSDVNPDYVRVMQLGIDALHVKFTAQPAFYGFSVRLVKNSYTITASSDPLNGGSILGTGNFNQGETCTLIAIANPGFTFSHWTVEGVVVSSSEEYSFVPQASCEVVAHFEPVTAVCDVVFDLFDSAGDGWYGNAVIVTPDGGSPTTLTLEEGAFCSYTLSLPSGSDVTLTWRYGFDPGHCSFEVHYDGGAQIGQFSGLDASFHFEFTPSCHAANSVPVTETTSFTTGWNWYSTYVECDENSLENLKNALAAQCNSALIKSQGSFISYQNGAWSGSLNSMDNTQMYMVLTDRELDYSNMGFLTNPANHEVTLTHGWNWIGYQLSEPKSLSEALNDLQPIEGDLIKSSNSFSYFNDGIWRGSLLTMEPGRGYFYLSNSLESRSFHFPILNLVPTIQTLAVGNITNTSAKFRGIILDDAPFVLRGFCYSTRPGVMLGDPDYQMAIVHGTDPGQYEFNCEDLQPNTTYYVKAFARTEQAMFGYGVERSFTTSEDALPTIQTLEVGNITSTSAKFRGIILDDAPFVLRGFCYSTSPNVMLGDPGFQMAIVHGTDPGQYEFNISDLTPNTTYYVKAFARTEHACFAYGVERSFTTAADALPTIQTLAVGNITDTSAKFRGIILDNAPFVLRGFCFSTSPNVQLGTPGCQMVIVHGSNPGQYEYDYEGLTPNRTYYVRAFARTEHALFAYGDEVSFNTNSDPLPTIQTLEVGNITGTSALFRGIILDNAPFTLRGFCFNTKPDVTLGQPGYEMVLVNGNSPGQYSYNYDGLTPNRTYYVRAFLRTEHGNFAYGEERSFSTDLDPLPTIQTLDVGNVTDSSAKFRGIILDNAPFVLRGFCYSTRPGVLLGEPGFQMAIVPGNNPGQFEFNCQELERNTTYYVKAFVRTEHGCFAYGVERSFYTNVDPLPTIQTLAVGNITGTSAKFRGIILDNAPFVLRGFCFSTSPNVQLDTPGRQMVIVQGNTPGQYEYDYGELTPNRTYYVKAFVRTEHASIAYGDEVSFRTDLDPLPTIQTLAVGNITGTSAMFRGIILDDAPFVLRGFCLSNEPGLFLGDEGCTGMSVPGNTPGQYSITYTELAANTTYYVKAFARTEHACFAYGDELSFYTNVDPLPTIQTLTVGNVTGTSAKFRGIILDNAPFVLRGFCFSTSPNVRLDTPGRQMVIVPGNDPGQFEYDFGELTPNRTYYVRAFVRTEHASIAYGDERSFQTTPDPLPTIQTLPVRNITATSARFKGIILDDEPFTIRGFCLSTEPGVLLGEEGYTPIMVPGNTPGIYEFDYEELHPNRTYYVKAFVRTEHGSIGYGDEVSFQSGSDPLPTIQTLPVGNITQTSAMLRGIILDDAPFVLRGFCIATEPGVMLGDPGFDMVLVNGTSPGQYSVTYTEFQPNTTYYVKAFARTEHACFAYGVERSFTTLDTNGGALNGEFTIDWFGNKVQFSKGNLQYIGSAAVPYWKFADHQWDYLGNNGQNSGNEYADRDCFGWGTSGWNCGNTYYQPWNCDYSNGTLYGPAGSNNLTDGYANSDWGVYNAIANGGNQAGQWRTLSASEWNFLFAYRNTSSGVLFAKANVNGVNGIILLPDDWSASYYALNGANNTATSFNANTITADDWTDSLEAHGAVFLPTAGLRYGTNSLYYLEERGCYWTSTCNGDNAAYFIYLTDSVFGCYSYSRAYGVSVRLVKNVP